MPIERAPSNPLPPNYVPQGGTSYRVKDGDDWHSVARQFQVNVAQLIAFNFKTNRPEEVNWYLRRSVGCNKPTDDGDNWIFSSSASPGIIYIPNRVQTATTVTIVHSTASMSWIDPRLYDPEDLPEVDRSGNPGSYVSRTTVLGRQVYRFANFLEAYIEVSNQSKIVDTGFTGDSDLYYRPSFRGIMPKKYATIRDSQENPDGKSVRFVQTVGCKTVSPETIGSRDAVKKTDTMLGIHPNWGGPIGVQLENLASHFGEKAAENFSVFPPIWTELELVISTDGSFSSALLRHSLFPSCSYYEQMYAVELLASNSERYAQADNYDAREEIKEWRSSGWGPLKTSIPGPTAGNPWHVPDPRILGTDIRPRPGIPEDDPAYDR